MFSSICVILLSLTSSIFRLPRYLWGAGECSKGIVLKKQCFSVVWKNGGQVCQVFVATIDTNRTVDCPHITLTTTGAVFEVLLAHKYPVGNLHDGFSMYTWWPHTLPGIKVVAVYCGESIVACVGPAHLLSKKLVHAVRLTITIYIVLFNIQLEEIHDSSEALETDE